MRKIRPEYEFPIEGRAWTQGALPEAGVFFLDGDCHIVARQGPAAFELEARGALLVALVRFDGRSAEEGASAHPVRSLGLREALARFAPPEPAEGSPLAGRFGTGAPFDREDPDGDP